MIYNWCARDPLDASRRASVATDTAGRALATICQECRAVADHLICESFCGNCREACMPA
jgi:hypothetical protein